MRGRGLGNERDATRSFRGAGEHHDGAAHESGQLGRDRSGTGLCLRPDGLALYGGVPRPSLAKTIKPVATIEAQVLQRRRVSTGETVGYNALWTATADTEVAIVNLGYADGYFRGFSNRGTAWANAIELPVIGRVSMDLVAVCIDDAPEVSEGDWIAIDRDVSQAATRSGMSQYELLTALGRRLDRLWSNVR